MNSKYYFTHDYNARNDRKIARLIHKHGMAGLGIYWCLIEMLYENDGYLLLSECECIANELRSQCDVLEDILFSDLFEKDDSYFWSNSVLKRLQIRNEKSQKARDSASKRWGDANAMPTQYEGNAIKEKINKNNNSICPYKDIVSLFNTICISLPKVDRITDSRKKKLDTRFNEYKNIDVFKQAFVKVEASNFCKGNNKGNWTATFDWLMANDKNMLKVIEGNYDNKKATSSGRLPGQNELAEGD